MNVNVTIDPRSSHNGFADVRLVGTAGSDATFRHRLDVEYQPMWDGCGPVPEVHSDLLLVAGAVYAIDKAVVRDRMPDRWTRSFSVRLPVQDPDRWEQARAPLESCVQFLTGDEWTFEFAGRRTPLVRPGARLAGRRVSLSDVDAIGLFSGGLDSLIGTIDWLEEMPGRILLVGHHDGDVAGPLTDQRRLLAMFDEPYCGRWGSVLPRVGVVPSGDEISFRSRSLLFLGLAIHAAGAARPGTPVLIPENGNIALNVPLTPSRQGSCSTRTAHPHYLGLLRAVLAALDVDVPVVNPLAAKTKGQCVLQCRNPGLLRAAYPRSASCAKRGHRSSWIRRDAAQCGRCIPCLYRRAALHAAGWDSERYGVDVCAGEIPLPDRVSGAAPKGAEDILAMLAFVREDPAPAEIARRLTSNGRIPPAEAMEAAALVGRAMDEVRALIADKATSKIKRAAGLPRRGRRIA
jgi:hypothetical protein